MIPPLHLITDDRLLTGEDFLPMARDALAAGGRSVALHIRGPGLEGRQMFELAEALQEEARARGSLLLVNDRVDVALALGLPGIHLGQRSLPPHVVRGIVGDDTLLGVSTHGAQEAEEADGCGADYLLVGTLFPTPSHPGTFTGGPERVAETAAVTKLPLFGIGGITPSRIAPVLAAGAHGVAVKGGVWGEGDPGVAVGVFLREMQECRGEP